MSKDKEPKKSTPKNQKPAKPAKADMKPFFGTRSGNQKPRKPARPDVKPFKKGQKPPATQPQKATKVEDQKKK